MKIYCVDRIEEGRVIAEESESGEFVSFEISAFKFPIHEGAVFSENDDGFKYLPYEEEKIRKENSALQDDIFS